MPRDMEETLHKRLVPGALVEVTQQIAHRNRPLTNTVRGTIVAFEQRQTGSWYAHSKDDKLWLDRLVLKKEDGEITTLNLDDYTRIEFKEAPAARAP
jgi:hypothetical protein